MMTLYERLTYLLILISLAAEALFSLSTPGTTLSEDNMDAKNLGISEYPGFETVPYYNLDALKNIIGDLPSAVSESLEDIRAMLPAGRNPVVWDINSVKGSGGVSDILMGLVSLSRQVGIQREWIVIKGNVKFFTLTKKWHNIFHGKPLEYTSEELENYKKVIDYNIRMLLENMRENNIAPPDIVILHDQQPLGMIGLKKYFPDTKFVWRCHIPLNIERDPDSPSGKAWKFIKQYADQCDAAVFHIPAYTPPGLVPPAHYILPTINLAALINRHFSREFIDATLKKYNIALGRHPLVLQNGRFDQFKDQKGVIEAWEKAIVKLIESGVSFNKIPRLIIAGPFAADDVEGLAVFKDVNAYADAVWERVRKLLEKNYEEFSKEEKFLYIQPMLPSIISPESDEGRKLLAEGIDPNIVFLTEEQIKAADDIRFAILRDRQKAGLISDNANMADINIEKELSPPEWHEMEISALQDASSVIFIKSIVEGFGLAATGAGSHGKARIASDVGGLSHQVINETVNSGSGTGFLVGIEPSTGMFTRQASIDEGSAILHRLIIEPNLREAVAARAVQHVTEQFNPYRLLHDHLKLTASVLRTARTAGLNSSPSASRQASSSN